jgi:phosphomannomutase
MLSVSGLRGTFGGSLSPAVVARFSAAFADFLRTRVKKGPPTVVIAADGRIGSRAVKDLAASALNLAGCDTVDLGIAMTPTVGVMVDHFKADAGLQITASHNPQDWCGLKPMLRPTGRQGKAAAPDKATASAIIQRYNDGVGRSAGWNDVGIAAEATGANETHAALVAELLAELGVHKHLRKARLACVLDHVNGSGMTIAPAFLDAIGVRCRELTEGPAGIFPHTPEPTKDNLTALCRAMKRPVGKLRPAIGLAQDPDADRLALVDERGTYIGEEYTLVLCAMALLELGAIRKGSTLCVNLSTSRMIEDLAAKHGCKVVRSAVGEANVVDAMRRHKSPLGGEGNGGVIWPQVTNIRDSLGAMGLVLSLLAWRGQSLSAIVKTIPSYAIVKRKVDLTPKIKPAEVLDRVAKKYAAHTPDRADGVWIGFTADRAWLHVRASNTEPIMRLIAEAPTAAAANALLDDAAKLIA